MPSVSLSLRLRSEGFHSWVFKAKINQGSRLVCFCALTIVLAHFFSFPLRHDLYIPLSIHSQHRRFRFVVNCAYAGALKNKQQGSGHIFFVKGGYKLAV